MQNNSFNHSIKVPKLYKCAAKISQEVAKGGSSIKQLVYEKNHFNTKALYALVVTTFQKANEIDLLLKRTKLLEKESRLDPWLAKILISELLWGKKQLPNSEAKPIQTILAYQQAFLAHLSDSSGDTQTDKSKTVKKPRYVRINTLVNPFNEAIELFQEEGWILQSPTSQNDYEEFLSQVSGLDGDFMLKDLHVPDLLIFPCGTEFYNHPGYKKGAIVLQDKASCLPAHILSPPPGSVVLDMCAAPGMKTTQLATVIRNEGTVYAIERDPKRFQVLNKIVETSGATCIKTINKDVLECGESDFPDVEYILVDPSCSASGMTDRLELQQNQDHQRLQKLAGFQIKILRSALTRYPKAKRVVYSTCSLYPEENEDVVRQVLETNNQFRLVPADGFLNKAWKSYGSPDYGDIGKFCLYARPDEDLTNGFFVAVFERLEEGENNQFFNGRVLNYRKNVEQKQARKEKKLRRNEESTGNEEQMEDFSTNQQMSENGSERLNEHVTGLQQNNNAFTKSKSTKKKQLNRETVGIEDKANTKRQNDETIMNKKSDDSVDAHPKKKKKKQSNGEADETNDDNLYNEEKISDEVMNKSEKGKRKGNEEETIIVNEVNDENMEVKSKKKKRKHKESQRTEERNKECEEVNVENIYINGNSEDVGLVEELTDGAPAKKSKKKKHERSETDISNLTNMSIEDLKLNKKKQKEQINKIAESNEVIEVVNLAEEVSEIRTKKKKKKHRNDENQNEYESTELPENKDCQVRERKKNKKTKEVEEIEEVLDNVSSSISSKKKRKKQISVDEC